MNKTMEFVAVCQYPGKEKFRFFSPSFYVEEWKDVERVGRTVVKDAWAEISPHAPPGIVKFLPGALIYSPVGELGNG